MVKKHDERRFSVLAILAALLLAGEPHAQSVVYSYDGQGRVASVAYPGGSSIQYSFASFNDPVHYYPPGRVQGKAAMAQQCTNAYGAR